MTIQQKLNKIVHTWSLLKNPFYVSWSAGTLTKDALQTYTSEYGSFISLLPLGWQTLGDTDTANEETEHHKLWEQFGKSLGAVMTNPKLPQTKILLEKAKKLFKNKATAIGAMYAFEVQQPKTAQSKKLGLQTHYVHLHADELYFDIHSHNEHESEKLLAMVKTLSPAGQKQAVEAAGEMSQALWDALHAVHKTCMVQ